MENQTLAEMRKKESLLRRDIGRNLKAIRVQKQQTLKRTAHDLGISANTLSSIENGSVRKLTIGRVMSICKYYEVEYYSVVNTSIMK
jgi:transcriptional regulator with XRE-family HTH domain